MENLTEHLKRLERHIDGFVDARDDRTRHTRCQTLIINAATDKVSRDFIREQLKAVFAEHPDLEQWIKQHEPTLLQAIEEKAETHSAAPTSVVNDIVSSPTRLANQGVDIRLP